jgi:membrane protein required for colicin V production
MTLYDAAMAGLVIAGMMWGAWRGITWQLASIASLVLGYSVAHPLSAQMAPRFPGEPVVARALAMLAIYAAVSGGVFLAAWIVRSTLRQLRFEAFDRHLGMVMGGLEGALLGLVATLFVVSLAPQTRAPIFASPAGRVVGQVMNLVGPVLPLEVRQALAPFWATPDGTIANADAAPISEPAPRVQQDVPDSTGNGRSSYRNSGPAASSAAATLETLIEDGESRLGRAIVETAEKGLQPQAGTENDRAVERR